MALQIEADRRLLNFSTYEEYLDSLVTATDLNNLQSTVIARKIAELGYRTSGDTLTREQFYRRLNIVREHFFPTHHPTDVVSKGLSINDIFLQELASREFGNRTGSLITIIFIRHFTKKGFEISAYIDYADRLEKQDWLPYFHGKRRFWPRTDDLSYYHWRTNKTYSKNTKNFKVFIDPIKGLLFQCLHDRKYICVDPDTVPPSSYTSRHTVCTDKYEHVILYDHVIRKRN